MIEIDDEGWPLNIEAREFFNSLTPQLEAIIAKQPHKVEHSIAGLRWAIGIINNRLTRDRLEKERLRNEEHIAKGGNW